MAQIHSSATLAASRVSALFCMLLKALKLGLQFRFPSSCLLILAFIVALTGILRVFIVLSTILSIFFCGRTACRSQVAFTCATGF